MSRLVFLLLAVLVVSPVTIFGQEDGEEADPTEAAEEEITEAPLPLALEAEADPDPEQSTQASTTTAVDDEADSASPLTPDDDDDSSTGGSTQAAGTTEAVTMMATSAAPDTCEKNNTGILVEKRKQECRSFCSETKKCRNVKADCKCDGVCGMVCILPEMKCPKPEPPENGEVETPEGLHFGGHTVYKCSDGYELIGTSKRICRGDHEWSGKDPFCTLKGVRCAEPLFRVENGSAAEGDITRSEYYVGEKVFFTCDDGYASQEGDVNVTECQLVPPDAAEWTNVSMSCSPKVCETPPSVEKASFEEKEYYFGDEVTYKCEPGFQILASPSRPCLANSSWGSDLPVCEVSKIVCPKPSDPENGKAKYESLKYGFNVTYECDLGYIINGTKSLECVEGGEWSDEVPQCVDIDCGHPDDPANGTIIFLSGTNFNAQVDFNCDENATPSGPTSAVCEQEGRWEPPIPECLQHCEVEELENAFMMFTGLTTYQRYNMIPTGVFRPHNSSVQLVCDEGYEVPSNESELVPRALADCSDGTWAPTAVCVEARCFCNELEYKNLEERNLLLAKECDSPLASGDEHQFKCHPTYPEMKMKGTLKCQQREWIYPNDTDIRCVLKSCSVKDIRLDHGRITKDQEDWQPDKDSNIVPNGTELGFECTEDGYELQVSGKPVAPVRAENVTTMRECQNGTWSGRMPVCKPARCLCNDLNETLPERGLKDAECEVMSSGQLLQLECLSGYSKPMGSLIAECQSGTWKDLTAECQRVCQCDELKNNLTGTSLQISGKCDDAVLLNDTITLECAKGYENMTGDAEAFCLDGLWELPDAFCNGNYCRCII